MRIKSNVWKKETSIGTLFIKKYEDEQIAEKVKCIHEQLEIIQFPYIIPLVESAESRIIIQPWQHESEGVDYEDEDDRKNSLHVLMSLHDTNQWIRWKDFKIIPIQNLFHKWNRRIEKFLFFENELSPYLDDSIYEITLYASKVLKNMEKSPSSNMTLLHGDVVHHNFLKCNDGMKLIDFDLACIGDSSEELILWMHRVLPQVDYNLEYLFNELPILYDRCLEKLHYLKYPNELLREWLYVHQLHPYEREQFLDYLLPFTEEALYYWPDLIAQVDKIQGEK